MQRRITALAVILVIGASIGLAALLSQHRREIFLVNWGIELQEHLRLGSQLVREVFHTLRADALISVPYGGTHW